MMELPPFESISQLYLQDCHSDAIFVPQYPTTYTRPAEDKEFYRNNNVYLVDDATFNSTTASHPGFDDVVRYRILPLFGEKIKISKPILGYPPKQLVQHWSRVMHEGKPLTWRTVEPGEETTHIVKFPFDNLPRELHHVDPDVLFEITSKLFIPKVNCRQAHVLVEELDYPCVLKVGRSEVGNGTYIIKSADEYQDTMAWIKSTMPNAETITTEFINTKEIYSTTIYLNRRGQVFWYSVFDMLMDDTHSNGCFFELDAQDYLQQHLKAVIEPVLDALHQKGYFGLISIDVLEDPQGNLYVVDINPRIGASALGIFGLYKLKSKGHKALALYPKQKFIETTIKELIQKVEAIEDGEVFLSMAWEGEGAVMADVNIYAADINICKSIFELCKQISIP